MLDSDFEKIEDVLETVCQENAWKTCKTNIRFGRPKIELFINEKERLSVIPVYKIGNSVKFTFHEGFNEYPLESLRQVDRNLEGYRFQMPQNDLLRALFIGYLDSKNKYPNREKRIKDAEHVLTREGRLKYFPPEGT